MAPNNLNEFLIDKLNQLPAAARLVMVLDSGAKLGLNEEIATNQHTWKVIRYDGNDLAFRGSFEPTQRTLVWVTGPKTQLGDSKIDLTSLLDIARRADDIFDASLIGALQALLPNEIWPEEPIAAYEEIISSQLIDFINAYQRLKPHLGVGTALSMQSIQAIILACLQPNIQAVEFLFRVDSPVALLKKYVTLGHGSKT